MDYKARWKYPEEIGEGGQGKVYRVLDSFKTNFDENLLLLGHLLNEFAMRRNKVSVRENFPSLRKLLSAIGSMDDPNNHGALKELHEPKEARDSERAEARIKNEIQAMSELNHPNLLRILDHDHDGKWFVSEFHPKGSLDKNKNLYMGDFLNAIKALRPLIEGVSEIHKKNLVHRDIKPQNVFVDSKNQLVLGDFGLVSFTDAQHTRISEEWENVGSRDWMPAWAMGIRVEDIKPTFDVFSLGKLLWAMISKNPILRLWYFEDDENNLLKMFPDAPYIYMANSLFKKCIVEREENCIPNATELLAEIDKMISVIDAKADLIGQDIERICKVCGVGKYMLYTDTDSTPGKIRNFGLSPVAGQNFKIFICYYCGHVQLFSIDSLAELAWTV